MKDLDASIVSMNTVETQTDGDRISTSDLIDTAMQTEEIGHACECLRSIHVHTQTEDVLNNNVETCIDCAKCSECELLKKSIQRLESDKMYSQHIVKETRQELERYEMNLNMLQKLVSDGNGRNSLLQTAVDSLQSKIMLLEAACASQREIIDGFSCDMCCVQSQTDCGNLLMLLSSL